VTHRTELGLHLLEPVGSDDGVGEDWVEHPAGAGVADEVCEVEVRSDAVERGEQDWGWGVSKQQERRGGSEVERSE
jgi:hypothetical protein